MANTKPNNTFLGLSAGKVLQVVQGTYASSTYTTSTSFVTMNLSVNITPSSASNKVLVLVSTFCQYYQNNNTSLFSGSVAIKRDSTIIMESAAQSFRTGVANYEYGYHDLPMHMTVLDSPATTSATTYALYAKVANAAHRIGMVNNTNSNIIAMEIEG